jgi:hypothetical protein
MGARGERTRDRGIGERSSGIGT